MSLAAPISLQHSYQLAMNNVFDAGLRGQPANVKTGPNVINTVHQVATSSFVHFTHAHV